MAEWEALARDHKLEVEFAFVSKHRLVTALTEARHAGRLRYWFGAELLTPEWQGQRLDEVIGKAGRRYTPRLHVEVETVHALHAVGRADMYRSRWQQLLAELRRARGWRWRAPTDVAEAFDTAIPKCLAALDELDAALDSMIAALHSSGDLPFIEATLDAAAEAVEHVDHLLHMHLLTKDGYFVGEAASLYVRVRDASGALRGIEQLANSMLTRAAREKVLLLTGRGGVGKTHLLCDVVSQRISEGRPSILILGQDFNCQSILSQIPGLTQIQGSLDGGLAVLDAAAEAAGCLGLFVVDALNESERPQRWRADHAALLAAAARLEHIAVVISCRSEFVQGVIGDLTLPAVEHAGFAEATDIAVRRFTHEEIESGARSTTLSRKLSTTACG